MVCREPEGQHVPAAAGSSWAGPNDNGEGGTASLSLSKALMGVETQRRAELGRLRGRSVLVWCRSWILVVDAGSQVPEEK